MDPHTHFATLARYNVWATRKLFESVFNHGSHHRGQISAAITALGHPCPELDLVWMLQAESAPS